MNPYEQYKQLEVLEEEVLLDQNVITDTSTETFIERLKTVLDNL